MVAIERVRRVIGVDVSGALNLVGVIVKYLSLAFLFPVAIAAGYDEPVLPFLGAGALAATTGWMLERITEGKERIGPREGFFVVSFTWLARRLLHLAPVPLRGRGAARESA